MQERGPKTVSSAVNGSEVASTKAGSEDKGFVVMLIEVERAFEIFEGGANVRVFVRNGQSLLPYTRVASPFLSSCCCAETTFVILFKFALRVRVDVFAFNFEIVRVPVVSLFISVRFFWHVLVSTHI